MASKDRYQSEETIFKTFLRSRGLVYTYARRLILEEINEIARTIKHFSIEDIYRQMRVKRNWVSKGTLYRTLRLLEKGNIVRKTGSSQNRYIYEKIDKRNVGHMVCLRCGKIIEMNQKKIKDTIGNICKKGDFKIGSHIFEINGICFDCARSG